MTDSSSGIGGKLTDSMGLSKMFNLDMIKSTKVAPYEKELKKSEDIIALSTNKLGALETLREKVSSIKSSLSDLGTNSQTKIFDQRDVKFTNDTDKDYFDINAAPSTTLQELHVTGITIATKATTNLSLNGIAVDVNAFAPTGGVAANYTSPITETISVGMSYQIPGGGPDIPITNITQVAIPSGKTLDQIVDILNAALNDTGVNGNGQGVIARKITVIPAVISDPGLSNNHLNVGTPATYTIQLEAKISGLAGIKLSSLQGGSMFSTANQDFDGRDGSATINGLTTNFGDNNNVNINNLTYNFKKSLSVFAPPLGVVKIDYNKTAAANTINNFLVAVQKFQEFSAIQNDKVGEDYTETAYLASSQAMNDSTSIVANFYDSFLTSTSFSSLASIGIGIVDIPADKDIPGYKTLGIVDINKSNNAMTNNFGDIKKLFSNSFTAIPAITNAGSTLSYVTTAKNLNISTINKDIALNMSINADGSITTPTASINGAAPITGTYDNATKLITFPGTVLDGLTLTFDRQGLTNRSEIFNFTLTQGLADVMTIKLDTLTNNSKTGFIDNEFSSELTTLKEEQENKITAQEKLDKINSEMALLEGRLAMINVQFGLSSQFLEAALGAAA